MFKIVALHLVFKDNAIVALSLNSQSYHIIKISTFSFWCKNFGNRCTD